MLFRCTEINFRGLINARRGNLTSNKQWSQLSNIFNVFLFFKIKMSFYLRFTRTNKTKQKVAGILMWRELTVDEGSESDSSDRHFLISSSCIRGIPQLSVNFHKQPKPVREAVSQAVSSVLVGSHSSCLTVWGGWDVSAFLSALSFDFLIWWTHFVKTLLKNARARKHFLLLRQPVITAYWTVFNKVI